MSGDPWLGRKTNIQIVKTMHGVDPSHRLTFAEIAPEQKLAVSHRGRAMGRMCDWLLENLLVCHIAGF